MLPQPDQIVRVRSRLHLVEEVIDPERPGELAAIRLSCLDDDAQGEQCTVIWDRELDAEILSGAGWERVARRGFDDPRRFAAWVHTHRWRCVTSTDAALFQAPYRAGIDIKAFQLEPLAKALALPRVNLLIADDVGLGKTIEAGLIVRELIQRQRVHRVVVACPSSVELQWQEEMEERFGLRFEIYDRAFVAECRRARGFAVNPWATGSRFIISHATPGCCATGSAPAFVRGRC